jgi:hypothetical protein
MTVSMRRFVSAGALLALSGAIVLAAHAQTQRTGSAAATVTVFKPLVIQSSAQMSFGKLQYNASSGPTIASVILSSSPPVTRTSNGVQLLPNGGETPAIRIITGEPGRPYRIAVANTMASPGGLQVASYTLWSQNSGNVTASKTAVLNAQGVDTIRIGATLSVPQKTKNDTFTATPAVTITYD